jgi:hypothetical protein
MLNQSEYERIAAESAYHFLLNTGKNIGEDDSVPLEYCPGLTNEQREEYKENGTWGKPPAPEVIKKRIKDALQRQEAETRIKDRTIKRYEILLEVSQQAGKVPQYGLPMSFPKLQRILRYPVNGNVPETTLRRFIKSDWNQRLNCIRKEKHGKYSIMNCYKTKLKELFSPPSC